MFFIMLSTIEDEQERLRIADIYEEYRYMCLHRALTITKDQQMAEDAVGDAFVEVIKHKEKIFSLDCNQLPSYIVTITKNKARDLLRKNKRKSDLDDDWENSLESDEIPIDEQVISKMGFERLLNLMASLDEKYKIVLEMKYVLDLSTNEISQMLNISNDNVKTRLFRARTQLRKLLGSEVTANA
ncbi:MAG: sigma-70 family RNA polymerase sigma factor [Oscillospiraceae bacterium]|nr:sigma-70 family RNA polymerase sigma factor [Oscillospiraceae bacterium]